MDGVDEPCSPTPPTGHQHQSGHLMCYEGRTSSRAIDTVMLVRRLGAGGGRVHLIPRNSMFNLAPVLPISWCGAAELCHIVVFLLHLTAKVVRYRVALT